MPPIVSRVATALSRSELALKYVCVSAARSSIWRWNSPVICDQVVADVAQVRPRALGQPSSPRIASRAAWNWSRWAATSRCSSWTHCLSR